MWRPFSSLQRLRKAVYISAGVLLCTECVSHVFPDLTVWSMQASDVTAPDSLVQHVRKISTAMGLPRPQTIRVFINSGFSSVCAGHPMLPGGVVIGLPRSVLYHSVEDVKQSGVTVFGGDVEWEGSLGEAIAKLLLPTASQVNFSIAHEVSHLLHADFLLRCLVAPASLLGSYYIALGLQAGYPHAPVVLIPIVLFTSVLVCAMLRRSLNHWQEFRADRRAAMCRPSYAVGGIELMRKRMALDSELVSRSQAASSTGSIWSLLSGFQTHPSFSERLNRLQQLQSVSHSHWGK